MMPSASRLLAACLCVLSGAASVAAQTPRDLASASIEELMQIEITSAGRKEQQIEDVAAAVYVITQDDIRRSGIRTLPELFRLVPGMQVAQINSNKWAVSVRGFNDVFSNKMLVLIDGRSIYKRTFSGVFWHAEDLMLEDVDRIEIIRGPGGATWGANAVNGVVNIITRSAADTQGAAMRLGAGTYDRTSGAIRYGGAIGSVHYRIFGLWADHGSGELADADAGDVWQAAKSGFRADWSRRRHSLMVQGSVLDGRQQALWVADRDRIESTARNVDVLGRWTYDFRPGAALQVQSFFSRQHLFDPSEEETETVADVDAEYHGRSGRHDVVAGGAVRTAHHADNGGSFTFRLQNARARNNVSSLFVQDEIRLHDRLRLTLGSKVEHDSTAGWNHLPTARVLWETVDDMQHVWAAVSRAVRTPALTDLNVRLNFARATSPQGMPLVIGQIGNPAYETEAFISVETGYRVRVGSKASFDLSAFAGDYDKLPTLEPQTPVFEATPAPAHLFVHTQYRNLLEVKTTGFEVNGEFRPIPAWRLEGSYSRFVVSPRPDEASRDEHAAGFDGNAPARQWQLRSSLALGPRTEINANLFHVGRLRVLGVPAYTRADARVEFKLRPQVSLIGTGQNLFDRAHAEFAAAPLTQTLVRRNVHFSLVWRF
jgi:iron complex outermembrane receptor protein